jgi:amino acid permease
MVDAFRYILTNMSAEMDGIERILEARQFWVLWGLAFVLPISFYRTLDSLKFTSTLSLIIIYALALGVVLYGHGLFNPCEGITASTNIEILLSETTTEEFVLEDEDLDLYYDNGPFLRRWLQRVLVEPLEIASQDAAEMFLEDNAPECRGDVEAWTDPIGTLKNLAIFVFSFTCHQNVFSVVNEIKNRTQLRVNMVITAAIGSALLLYLIVATEGYRTYGSNVMGNILLNYPQTALVTIMRISISVMVILSYPLQLDPARRCITSFVHALKQRSETRDVEGTASFTKLNTNDPDELGGIEKGGITVELSAMKLDTKKTAEGSLEAKGCIHEKTDKVVRKDSDTFLFNCITCTFIALSFLISLVVTDLGTILAVVGATGSTMVSYILPGGIYIKLHPKFTITKALAYLQLIVGCIIIPTALYFVVFFGTVE